MSGRRRLTAVWLVLAVLAVGIGVLEYRDRRVAASRPAGEHDERRLLTAPLAELGAIEIAESGRLHRFERDASGAWFYHGAHAAATPEHTHAPDPALAERIERAFAAFARTRVERVIPLGADGAAYGVASPSMLVLVYRPRETQPLAQYAIGAMAPDTVSRYVTMVGSRVVATIPNYQIDNLLALVQTAGGAAATAQQAGKP